MQSSSAYSYEDLVEGQTVEEDYQITGDIYERFLTIFPDRSPVHVNESYARTNGFQGLVMHGAILNGFLSHFVGMRLPGRRSLELAVDIRYLRPSYLGDVISLQGTITQKLDSRRVVVVDVIYHNRTQNVTVARARVQAAIMAKEEGLSCDSAGNG